MLTVLLWTGFLVFILGMLAVDLGILNRKARVITTPEALAWTVFCISLALAFNFGVYHIYDQGWISSSGFAPATTTGKDAAIEFFTGYLLEMSLSLDNVLVIALIFSWFRVPLEYQHRVLFWGIVGALLMRGVMIFLGVALITRFAWVTYVFGGLLLLAAGKMLLFGEGEVHPDRNPLVRLARRFYPVSSDFDRDHFFTHVDGRWAITPLFLVLLVVESSDVLFAIDSIPAIFGVTHDPFIVFTSNVFAILCLRSMYFALAGLIDRLRFLKVSLIVVLLFIGVKLLLAQVYHIPVTISLMVIAGVLLLGMIASVLAPRKPAGAETLAPAPELHLAGMTYRVAKRVIIMLIGSSVLLIGVAMLALPGPGSLVIPAGLAILATEFVWARYLLNKFKQGANAVAEAFIPGRRAAREARERQVSGSPGDAQP